MSTTDEIRELMRRAAELPYGEARTVMCEEALRRAEAAGDRSLVFETRIELTSAYQYGGEKAKSFATFSRSLADFDSDPTGLPQWAEHSLLWQFKWTVNALLKFPDVPLDRTLRVLDDMERRYRAGGHSLHAVYGCRTTLAQHLGDSDAADHWYTLWHTTPRDELSDCIGCEPTSKVYYLTWRAREAHALEVAEPVLNAELNCREQPQGILTALLPLYLSTGRLEQARDAHRRAYRVHRTRLADLDEVSDHLVFLALSGNEARGFEVLERHIDWLDRAPSPAAAMRFAAAAALLLRRVAALGGEGLTVRRSGTPTPLPELLDTLTAQAVDLAARFDARNGTTEQSRLINARINAEPRGPGIPLSRHQATPPPEPAPVPEAPSTQDPVELLEIGWTAWTRSEPHAAVVAWQRYDAVVNGTDFEPTPWHRARRTEALAMAAWFDRDLPAAVEHAAQAEALYTEAADQEAAMIVACRRGRLLVAMDQVEEGLALVRSSYDWLSAHAGCRDRVATTGIQLANVHLQTGRPEEAKAVLDDLGSETVDGQDRILGDLRAAQGHTALALDDVPSAIGHLRQAAGHYREADLNAALTGTLVTLAQALTHVGEDAEAGALLEEILAKVPGSAEPARLTAHAMRGERLLRTGDAVRAVEDFAEAVAGFTALGDQMRAVHLRVDLCEAYLRANRYLDAAEAAEEALPELERFEDPTASWRCRFFLAHALQGLGEDKAAAEAHTLLAEALRAEQPGRAAQQYGAAGELLTKIDNDATAALRFTAAAELSEVAGDAYGVVGNGRRAAMCLLWSGEPVNALERMAAVRSALSALPAENQAAISWEAAVVDFDEARILLALERRTEALANLDRAVAAFRALNENDAAKAAEALRNQI